MGNGVRCQKLVVVRNATGLHVRAAGAFVDTAQRFAAEIRVRKGEREADGKSIIQLLTLGAEFNAPLLLMAEGKDAQEAIGRLEQLVEAQFGLKE
jgi:phosphotransferase system HPr (HPr) family protein